MNLQELDELLDVMPAMADRHPLSELFLREPLVVANSASVWVHRLDSPAAVEPVRVLLPPDRRFEARFPLVTLEHDPFVPELNPILGTRLPDVAERILRQSRVAGEIARLAEGVDAVVVVLWDGLSYTDVRHWPEVEPCLVDTLSCTPQGMRNVVGDPPISRRLHDLGLVRQYGYSYWDRGDQQLSDRLFRGIGVVQRANGWGDVMAALQGLDLGHSYVQVVRAALDPYAHQHKEAVPRDAVIAMLRQELDDLVALLARHCHRALVCCCADHGLLWCAEHEWEVVGTGGGNPPARYCDERGGVTGGVRFETDEGVYWSLPIPKARRRPIAGEQAFHGGVSLAESLVPFFHVEVGGC